MVDVVCTVPKDLWHGWIEEGDSVGLSESGVEWGFFTYGARPKVELGDRCYIVSHGRLRGYAPITRVVFTPRREGQNIGKVVFCRKGGAVAVTIKAPIRGFRGYQYRWWDRKLEIPFPDWKTEGVPVMKGITA
jgi:hypothetical protein